MRVLVTGGAGFIGSHLCEYHVKRGDKVYAVDNLTTGLQSNLDFLSKNKNFQYEIADILTWPQLYEAVLWADRVYHMAAVVGVFRVLENPVAVLSTNVLGCERILRAVEASKRPTSVLIASSSEVYGVRATQPLKEDDELVYKSATYSRWTYPISKLTTEAFGLAYATSRLGLGPTTIAASAKNIVIARLFNTIGPRQTGIYGMVVPRFIKQAIARENITVYGSGEQTRSFCDVRDLVVMLDKLMSADKAHGQIVNVGNDREISITDLANMVKNITKSSSSIEYISYEKAYGVEFDEMMRRKPSLKKLNHLISYQYAWKLEDTISYLYKSSDFIK